MDNNEILLIQEEAYQRRSLHPAWFEIDQKNIKIEQRRDKLEKTLEWGEILEAGSRFGMEKRLLALEKMRFKAEKENSSTLEDKINASMKERRSLTAVFVALVKQLTSMFRRFLSLFLLALKCSRQAGRDT